jgi:hypothetical protein
MSVSEASMSAMTFAGFPNDRRTAIPTSDATRTKILALRSSNEPRTAASGSAPATIARYWIGPADASTRKRSPTSAARCVCNPTSVAVAFRIRQLAGLLILHHDRRQILWLGVTAHPSAEWISHQLTEAYGWKVALRCII